MNIGKVLRRIPSVGAPYPGKMYYRLVDVPIYWLFTFTLPSFLVRHHDECTTISIKMTREENGIPYFLCISDVNTLQEIIHQLETEWNRDNILFHFAPPTEGVGEDRQRAQPEESTPMVLLHRMSPSFIRKVTT